MDLNRRANRYYAYVVMVGFRGVRIFKSMKFMTEILETKESSSQISNRASKYGWPVTAYSNKAKCPITIQKCLIESDRTNKKREYIALDVFNESDYITDGLDMTKKQW